MTLVGINQPPVIWTILAEVPDMWVKTPSWIFQPQQTLGRWDKLSLLYPIQILVHGLVNKIKLLQFSATKFWRSYAMADIWHTRSLTIHSSLEFHDIKDVCGTYISEKCLRPFIWTLAIDKFSLVGNLYMIWIVWQIDAKVTSSGSYLLVFMPLCNPSEFRQDLRV